MTPDRNRVTVRRALRAGGMGALLGAVAMGVLVVTSNAPGGAVVAAAVAMFGLVSASWLLLAALLDILAGDPPDRRRTLWTIATTLLAMLGPFLVLGAIFQPVTSGGGS